MDCELNEFGRNGIINDLNAVFTILSTNAAAPGKPDRVCVCVCKCACMFRTHPWGGPERVRSSPAGCSACRPDRDECWTTRSRTPTAAVASAANEQTKCVTPTMESHKWKSHRVAIACSLPGRMVACTSSAAAPYCTPGYCMH